jgi:hypothetical protein
MKTMPGIDDIHHMLHQMLRNPAGKEHLAQSLLVFRRNGWGIRQGLDHYLGQLEEAYSEYAALLRQRFIEKRPIKHLAPRMNLSESQFNRLQQSAIRHFAHWVLALEEELRSREIPQLLSQLPAMEHSRLVGRQQEVHKLQELLRGRQAPWILGIAGMGGSGKTALAVSALHGLAHDFYYAKIIWAGARRNEELMQWSEMRERLAGKMALPADSTELENAAKQQAHLIAIDDLGCEALNEDWKQGLRFLVNPSKVVLLSRRLPSVGVDFQIFALGELSYAQGLELLRAESKKQELKIDEKNLRGYYRKVYGLVGGNAAMLKLSVQMLCMWPVNKVLGALRNGSGEEVARLYAEIYEPSWRALSEEARQLLSSIPANRKRGLTVRQLLNGAGLEESRMLAALSELVGLCFLEKDGSATHPVYQVSNLTKSYLRIRAGK